MPHFDLPETPVALPRQEAELSEILSRLAAELGALAGTASGLESVVGELVARSPTGGRHLETVQALDHLVQSLTGLKDFVSILGPELTRDNIVNLTPAIAVLRLSDLAGRLRGDELDRNGPNHTYSGDLELL